MCGNTNTNQIGTPSNFVVDFSQLTAQAQAVIAALVGYNVGGNGIAVYPAAGKVGFTSTSAAGDYGGNGLKIISTAYAKDATFSVGESSLAIQTGNADSDYASFSNYTNSIPAFQIYTGYTPTRRIVAQCYDPTTVGLTVKAAASQSANIAEIVDPSFNVLAAITNGGSVNVVDGAGFKVNGNTLVSAYNGTNSWTLGSGSYYAANLTPPGSGGINYTGHFNLLAQSPAQLTSSQNNYLIGAGYFQRISLSADWSITGIVPYQDGEERLIVNVSSFNLTLSHQSASSVKGNRFLNSTGADIVLAANQAADLIYDSTTQRWRVFKRA